MAANASIISGATIGGKTVYKSFTETSDHPNCYQDISLAVSHEGDLTTRTDNTDGVITLDAAHGLATGAFDVYWDGGMRYSVDCVIVTNACTITGGDGDNLPPSRLRVIT